MNNTYYPENISLKNSESNNQYSNQYNNQNNNLNNNQIASQNINEIIDEKIENKERTKENNQSKILNMLLPILAKNEKFKDTLLLLNGELSPELITKIMSQNNKKERPKSVSHKQKYLDEF